jgi:hypothetical protein
MKENIKKIIKINISSLDNLIKNKKKEIKKLEKNLSISTTKKVV